MFGVGKKNNNCKATEAKTSSQVIYAPIRGRRVELTEVEDIVFSEKILGDGVAIEPKAEELYSPVDGIVNVVFPTKHVIGIKADNGAELIIHVGIDTVELNGEGFEIKVQEGERVSIGDLLMTIDLDSIRKSHKATTMIVIGNSIEYSIEHNLVEIVQNGNELMRIQRK